MLLSLLKNISLKCFWLIIHQQYPEGSFWSFKCTVSCFSLTIFLNICALCSEHALDCSAFLSLLTGLSVHAGTCAYAHAHTVFRILPVLLRSNVASYVNFSLSLCMYYTLYFSYSICKNLPLGRLTLYLSITHTSPLWGWLMVFALFILYTSQCLAVNCIFPYSYIPHIRGSSPFLDSDW